MRTLRIAITVMAVVVVVAVAVVMPLQQSQAVLSWQHQQQQMSTYYCDCPGGACVSSSWPCPSDNDGWNGQGKIGG